MQHPEGGKLVEELQCEMTQKLNIDFSKKGQMRFISHLDLMRLFQRALRRAELPIAISKGFNPRPKVSVIPALKLGEESDSLSLTVKLDEWIKPSLFRERLQAELPEGIKLKEAGT